MFTIHCATCNAKLAVKSEDLIGQILPCPKCGAMVLVERPNGNGETADSTSEPESHQPFIKFPDLFSETESGYINTDALPEPIPQPVSPLTSKMETDALSPSELKTRKIMLGILFGLLGILVVAGGILASCKSKRPIQVPRNSTDPAAVVEPKEAGEMPAGPASETPALPASEKPVLSSGEIPALPSGETPATGYWPPATVDEMPTLPVDEPRVRSASDILSQMERKLPALFEADGIPLVDIPDQLAQPLAGIKIQNVPLLAVLRTISELIDVPMTLDVDELFCRNIQIGEPVTADIKNKTVGDVLAGILAPRMEAVIEDRQILVTIPPEERDRLEEQTFDVADLDVASKDVMDLRGHPDSEGHLSPERLAEIVRRLVDPIGFRATVPQSSPPDTDNARPLLYLQEGNLIVRHRVRMLDRSLRLLEQIRVLRKIEQKTAIVGENLVPEAFGWDTVHGALTLNYYQPTPISTIFHRLEESASLKILIDHRSLHRALCPAYTIRATVRCNRGTVDEALGNLFGSINTVHLDYRILGSHVIEVTTRDTVDQTDKMSIEIHQYETATRLLEPDRTPEELVHTIRATLAPKSWCVPNDPESVGLGDIIIDRPSGCLLVRQSQPVQRQLRLWLGKRFISEQ